MADGGETVLGAVVIWLHFFGSFGAGPIDSVRLALGSGQQAAMETLIRRKVEEAGGVI